MHMQESILDRLRDLKYNAESRLRDFRRYIDDWLWDMCKMGLLPVIALILSVIALLS